MWLGDWMLNCVFDCELNCELHCELSDRFSWCKDILVIDECKTMDILCLTKYDRSDRGGGPFTPQLFIYVIQQY